MNKSARASWSLSRKFAVEKVSEKVSDNEERGRMILRRRRGRRCGCGWHRAKKTNLGTSHESCELMELFLLEVSVGRKWLEMMVVRDKGLQLCRKVVFPVISRSLSSPFHIGGLCAQSAVVPCGHCGRTLFRVRRNFESDWLRHAMTKNFQTLLDANCLARICPTWTRSLSHSSGGQKQLTGLYQCPSIGLTSDASISNIDYSTVLVSSFIESESESSSRVNIQDERFLFLPVALHWWTFRAHALQCVAAADVTNAKP